MTTTTTISSSADFNKDWTKLETAADEYHDAVEQHQNEVTAYNNELQSAALNINSGSSWQQIGRAYDILLVLLSGAGSNVLSSELGIRGSALNVQGKITACGNDLQNITQSTNTGKSGQEDLSNEAGGLDDMLNALGGTASQNNAKGADWFTYVQESLGGAKGTTASSLDGEFNVVRQDINWTGDTNTINYNPTGTSYYFSNPASSSYLNSFGEMQANMGLPGDHLNASEASKSMVNAFNTNTSTTQSANAAANESVSQQANTVKTVTSFFTDMMHAQQEVIKAIISHTGNN